MQPSHQVDVDVDVDADVDVAMQDMKLTKEQEGSWVGSRGRNDALKLGAGGTHFHDAMQ